MIYSMFLWRKGFRQDDRTNYILLLVAFGLHSTAMIMRGFRLNHCPVTNLYEATTFAAWTIVAGFLIIGVWARVRLFCAFASPVPFCIWGFAVLPALDASHVTRREPGGALTSP